MTTLSQRVLIGRRYLEQVLAPEQNECLERLAAGELSFCFLKDLPTQESRKEQEIFSESLALGLLGKLNLRPVSYRNEYDGKLIHDIMPRKGKESEKSSSGRAVLPFHTDMAFLRFPGENTHTFKAAAPDFLILVGIVNESNTHTALIDVNDIVNNLSDSDVQILGSPKFDVCSPANVVPPKKALNVALLFEDANYGRLLRFNGGEGVIEPHSDAEEALNNLCRVIDQKNIRLEFDVQPGTILAFNNRKVVHGRGAIGSRKEAGERPADRHFKRVYGQYIETDCVPLFPNNPFMQTIGG